MKEFDDTDRTFYDFEYFFGSADIRVFSRAHGGRYEFLLPYLKSHFSAKRVLDVGCGSGYLTKFLADLGNEVTGVDNSEAAITICKARYPDLEFILSSAYELADTLRGRKFELVTAFDVIEHLHNQELFMEAIANLLIPKGRLLLTTDNMDYQRILNPLVKRILRLSLWFSLEGLDLKMIKRTEKTKLKHLNREPYSKSHVSLYRPAELEELLIKSGFRILNCEFFPLYRARLYELLAAWLPKGKRYDSVIFLAERRY
jgi:2-polyprenyl-3-methyl-5-hydroxy-6-metoxy-1,4-benzoquinol methylase